MSYYRIYPERNNTIFRYGNYQGDYLYSFESENINAGANSIMELMDGKGESQLLFGFKISDSLFNKLVNFSFTAKLQLWDAGTLWEPAIKLKTVELETFPDTFVEGDGYSFTKDSNKEGVSNWLKATSETNWVDVTFTPITSYHLNRINEDLNFDVSAALINYFSNIHDDDTFFNLSLKIANKENDSLNIYRKFIHSIYTKTVFKPYIEFFIDDVIVDKTFNCYAGESNRIFLVNKSGYGFTGGKLRATIIMDGAETVVEVDDYNDDRSIVYTDLSPITPSTSFKKEFCTIIWKTNDGLESIAKEVIEIKNKNTITSPYNINNLIFYPVCPSTHNTVKQGDIIPFNVISEIKHKHSVIIDTYEYKVVSMDGFEMCPWTPVSVYKNQMYFNINTDYYFPEQHYEVFLRNKTDDFTLTSHLTYKFKLEMNDKSHLRELSSSPYYSRQQNFHK